MNDVAHTPRPLPTKRPRFGLSWKLLSLTLLFVVVAEALIFVPSIANFRMTWLKDRLATAEAASVVLTASDWTDVPREVQDNLLAVVGADALAIRDGQISRLLATVEMPPAIERVADTRAEQPWTSLWTAMAILFETRAHTLRIVGETAKGTILELVLSDETLHEAMVGYSMNVLIVTLLIAVLTGAVVFLALNNLLVWPMRRMSEAMIAFSASPEDPSRIITPSGRADELGVAEEHLASMQRDLQATLQQQRRLADLGLAVSKINHDLRNLLASAQLMSDRLTSLPDPTVQRFAPKLMAALGRAIDYCQSTLAYGRANEAAPERRLMTLFRLVGEVADTLGLDGHPVIRWENTVPPGLEVDADPDQLFRVLVNLCRNAVQAMETDPTPALVRRLILEARRNGGVVTIRVKDTGPGVPPKARAHLFQAFQGSARPGGTGLGLAIAAELVRAHGGTIELADGPGPGAAFEIVIPDRPLEFTRAAARAHAG